MANSQLIIFTPVPGNLQLAPETIKISVLVSPRLRGVDRLGGYPDWARWAQSRLDAGLRFTFECAGRSLSVAADTGALRPDLWSALFNDETYVRSHVFDDYSDSFVSSYSNRIAQGLIKTTYQAAGVELAIPPDDGDPRERGARLRGRLRSLMADYSLQWDNKTGQALRAQQRDRQRASRLQAGGGSAFVATPVSAYAALDQNGQIATGSLDPDHSAFHSAQQQLAADYGVFSHQPQGADVSEERLDKRHVLDFHQALSSLGAYRQLQRDLGLVFDLELRPDFLAQTSLTAPGEIAIVAVDGRWNADTLTVIPPTKTAYIHATIEGQPVFAVATLAMHTPTRPALIGLLELDKRHFGVAQLDIDGAVHKTLMHADNIVQLRGESPSPNDDVFDPAVALSSPRSGGLSLFADARALTMLDSFDRSRQHNSDLEAGRAQQSPFYAEDLTRGYRLDVWDTRTRQWHSLHRRDSVIHVGQDAIEVRAADEEGFIQAAATQAAPEADGTRANTDLHLHEALVRWPGWSLSAPAIGTHLTRDGDPDRALPDPAAPDPENEAVTPFELTVSMKHVKGSLPRLRFGAGYRLRLRQVDLAGNGLGLDDEAGKLVTPGYSIPRGGGVVPYLRFEPVAPPVIVARDTAALTGPGSSADRLVIRTFNNDLSLDGVGADLTAADRHVAPPEVHVEMAERHGMFDDATGRLSSSAAMWQLIRGRDGGSFQLEDVPGLVIDGVVQKVPVESASRIDALPYLSDPLARAAAFRDLPGSTGRSIARLTPGVGPAGAAEYVPVADAQPRPGAVTIVEFGGRADWQAVKPFRLALSDGDAPPRWDPQAALLTVSLPKASFHVIRTSSCCDSEDLKYLGIWTWLREYIDHIAASGSGLQSEFYASPATRDRLAHVVQLAGEGGHGMLTAPRLLTLVHAVQQPLGRPQFERLTAQLPNPSPGESTKLQTQPETEPTADTELAVLSAWREPGSTDAFLVGALSVHAASTAKVDIMAEWTDPFDDLTGDPGQRSFAAAVDELPLPDVHRAPAGWYDPYLRTTGDARQVGFYVRVHDLIVFGPGSTDLGLLAAGEQLWSDAAPRHRFGDTRHHVVTYTAVATSRYREYFEPEDGGHPRDFTRTSEPVVVHVPASARPAGPKVRYVVPTFGWERASAANQLRSIRTGGGLRVYLDRPWHSSGVGELLGVTLAAAPPSDREEWKGLITQWGQDPIWQSEPLPDFPSTTDFPDAVASERALPLDARDPQTGEPRKVDVVGHELGYDDARGLHYCDLTVNPATATYAPFIRLALARYQPYALVEAKLSRVVLADFTQLTPERALTVTADPFTPGVIQVAVSGPAPTGPVPSLGGQPLADRPTTVTVTVQEKNSELDSDLEWMTAADFAVVPGAVQDPPAPDFILWTGTVSHTGPDAIEPGRYRLLIQEHELYEVDRGSVLPGDVRLERGVGPPGPALGRRLVYAETVPLDAALLSPPPSAASSTSV